jgi:hypothetical protein
MALQLASAESVGAWSTFVLAWLGLLALGGTVWQVLQTRREAKRSRTLDYLRHLYSLKFAPLNTQVLIFLRTADPRAFHPGARFVGGSVASGKAVRGAFDRLDMKTQSRVFLVLNFYEELSCSYLLGLLDDEVAGRMLLPTVAVWTTAKPFIEEQRAELRERLEADAKFGPGKATAVAGELMCEWQTVADALKEPSQPRSRKRNPADWFGSRAFGVLGALAVLFAIGALVAIAATASAHDVPQAGASFLIAAAAGLAVLALVALVRLLAGSGSIPRALLVGSVVGTLAITLTAGLTVRLDLDSSAGPEGSPGSAGKRGWTGREGDRGPKGDTGHRGTSGMRGPRGRRGPDGARERGADAADAARGAIRGT